MSDQPDTHQNFLVIVADDGDMLNVLRAFANNFASAEEVGFGTADFEGIDDAETLWCVVGPLLKRFYEYAFTGVVTGRDLLKNPAPAWQSPTSSTKRYITRVKRHAKELERMMQAFAGASSSSGLGVSGTVNVYPVGLPFGDFGRAALMRRGSLLVLAMCYDTTWEPNYAQLVDLFHALPHGEYGVAFLDSDDKDRYRTVAGFHSLLHGGETISADTVENLGKYEVPELDEQTAFVMDPEYDGSSRSSLGMTAWGIGGQLFSRWLNNRSWDSFSNPFNQSEDYFDTAGLELTPIDCWSLPPINWDEPRAFDLHRIYDLAIQELERLPQVEGVGLPASPADDYERMVMGLVPGEPLRVVANWNNPDIRPVALDVYTAGGTWVGCVDMNLRRTYRSRWDGPQGDDGNALALMLSHVRAYVDLVSPRGLRPYAEKPNEQWKSSAKYPEVFVRMELTDEPLTGLLDEVRMLMGKPTDARRVESQVEEAE